ncbi:MFS general substrate transporter, partial [Glonium stellatum]
YDLAPPKTALTRTLPILLCLRNPSLLTSLFLGLIQAMLLGAFDATVPLVANTRYNFDSLSAGLLFLPLGASDLLLGPLFGWAVDRYGTKPLAVLGYAYLVPVLTLLRLPLQHPAPGQTGAQVALFAALLALNGVGFAIINAPALVEAGAVVERFWKRNPALFGERGPYAQLYGFNSMVWSGGLTLGPLVAGSLRERIGYGNMCAVLAGICAVTAGLALAFVEGTLSEWWRGWKERREGEEEAE